MKRVFAYAVFLLAAVLSLSFSHAQNQQSEKKVIKRTVDSKGFEHELTEVDLMYQTAQQYMSAGLYDKAAAELEKVVAADSTRKNAWHDLANSYNKLKEYDKTAAALMRAHSQWPTDLYILSSLGFAEVNANMLPEAMKTYGEMLALDSLSYDANVHLAFIYQRQGEKVKAVRYYEKALKGKEDDIQTMGSLAMLYTDLGQIGKAEAIYEKAVAVAPDNQVLEMRLGTAYITGQHFDKAVGVFEKLVQQYPDNPSYRINLGISYAQTKRPKEAIDALEKAIELKPDAGSGYQQLVELYNETNQYNKAIATAKKGIEYSDQKSALYCLWGKSLEKLKLYDEAIAKFKLAVNDPQWGEYARKQIDRQQKLKIREEKIKEQSLE
jgi:tetratricopeptide (TPR) repeat protein